MMTVTTLPGPDVAGKTLDAAYTAIKATVSAAPAASPQLYGAQAAQAAAEFDLLNHNLASGRLSPVKILAANVFGSAGGSSLTIPSIDLVTTALKATVTAIGTPAAGFQQTSEQAALDAANLALLYQCIAKSYTTPAFILASSTL
jgi:hypothetical protein